MSIKNLFLILILVNFFYIFNNSYASLNVQMGVEGCNNNNICELPENEFMCANDCTSCNFNNICETLKGETTLSCSSDCLAPAVRRSSGSTIFNIENTDLNIKRGINYAIISWNTSVASYGSVNFGRGDSYNDGVVSGIGVSNKHEIVLENLTASTTYSFFVSSGLPGYEYSKKYGVFETLPLPEIKKIPLISNFIASPSKNEIVFSWMNPDSASFSGVRIVRSPFFYPINPFDGKIIYEGSGNYMRDSTLDFDTKYYYAAFSYDKDLKYSSGVLLESILRSPQSEKDPEIREKPKTPIESSPIRIIDIRDYIFLGGDIDFGISSSTIRVYPFNDLKVLIEGNKLPEDIKIMILNVYNKNDTSKVVSYSFSYDTVKNVYYLEMPNTNDKQIHPFSIIAYDKSNNEISRSSGFFDMRSVEVINKFDNNLKLLNEIFSKNKLSLTIILVIIIVIISFFIIK